MKYFVPTIVMVFTFGSVVPPVSTASAAGFDNDDFIVAWMQSGRISVYDSDLTFKHHLVTNFPQVAGLDFDAAGNLVAAGGGWIGVNARVRVFDNTGAELANWTNSDLGTPLDIKVGTDGNYYVAGLAAGLQAFAPDGTSLGQLRSREFWGVAALPGNHAMAGGYFGILNSFLRTFDLSTGERTGVVTLDHGQDSVGPMSYSRATDTVLISDPANRIFERQTDGTFVRSFASGTDTEISALGVTRGPGGDVFATQRFRQSVYRWSADGTWIGDTQLSGGGDAEPRNIVWAGNIAAAPPGDCDGDGDVDLADFAEFESCMFGPDGGLGADCGCFDTDGDGDTDMVDFSAFQVAFTGG